MLANQKIGGMKLKKQEKMLDKLNLQLFAEGEPEEKNNTGAEPEEKKEEKIEPTIEEILKEKEKEWKSEIDRRVNQARAKWEKELKEKERLAKLSEEEKIEELKRIKEEELAERERELEIKTAKLEIFENLKEAGLLDAESIFKPENYIGENKEQLAKDIEALQTFIKAREDLATQKLRNEVLTGGEIPGQGNTETGEITKDKFEKMSYMERVELFNKNPELYRTLTK